MSPAETLAAAKAVKVKRKYERRRPLRETTAHRCLAGEARAQVRLTLADVGRGCGLSAPTVREAERDGDVKLSTATRLAKFYGKTIEELWPDLIKPDGKF